MNLRTLRSVLLPAVLLTLSLATPAAAAASSPCADADLTPSAENVAQLRAATLCLLNRERTRHRLKRFTESPQLRKSAQNFSVTMVRESFFDHVGPDGSTLLSRVRGATTYLQNVRAFALGENLAYGTAEYSTPAQTVKGWMESAGHRHNILLRRFRHVGIGIAIGAPVDAQGMPAATYAVDFGYHDKR